MSHVDNSVELEQACLRPPRTLRASIRPQSPHDMIRFERRTALNRDRNLFTCNHQSVRATTTSMLVLVLPSTSTSLSGCIYVCTGAYGHGSHNNCILCVYVLRLQHSWAQGREMCEYRTSFLLQSTTASEATPDSVPSLIAIASFQFKFSGWQHSPAFLTALQCNILPRLKT